MEEDNVGVTSLDLVVGKLLARCAEKLNEEASIYMNYEIPEVKLGGNPPSGKESRRTKRMLELRKRKGRL